jgi:metallo-beta-lactamase class B
MAVIEKHHTVDLAISPGGWRRMPRMWMTRRIVLSLVWVCSVAVAAQGPPGGRAGEPPASDAAEVQRLLAQAREAAGREWTEAFDFICAQNPNQANRPDDPLIQPTRVFDNLFAVGRSSTTVWVVRTSAGLVLIDAGYADQLETVLLAGLRQLGLDPEQVRYVLIGHGHADHYGAASYFQKRGARVGMAAADWDLLNAPPAGPGRGGTPVAPALPPPARDLEIAEGRPITVGDVTFTPVAIPGHTPGSLGFVFPVRDGAAVHTAGLFGGSILIPGFLPSEGLAQYIKSVEHWAAVAAAHNVDVEIQNHPLYDGMLGRLDRLRSRQPGQPHPFVVGRDAYQRFTRVMADCIRVQLSRRIVN